MDLIFMAVEHQVYLLGTPPDIPQSGVVIEWLRGMAANVAELGMNRVQNPVVLRDRQSGWNNQNRRTQLSRKRVPNRRQRLVRRIAPPSRGQIAGFNPHPGDFLWNLGLRNHEVYWRPVRIHMHQVFDHRKREVLRRVDNASSRPGPAATVTEAALAVEWSCRKWLAQQPVNGGQ